MSEPKRFLRTGPVLLLLAGSFAALTGRPVPSHAQVEASIDTASAAPADTVTKRDLMDILHILLGRADEPVATPPPRRGISRSLLPSMGYNPNAGLSLGASMGLGGWFGDPADTRLSSGILSASYSTEGQTSVQFKSNFNLPRNAWILLGDWRYLNTNQPTFGLGPTAEGQPEYPMRFLLYRLHETATRRLKATPLSVGLGYLYDRYENIRDTRASQGESTPYTEYNDGRAPTHSQSSGVALTVLYDTRDNQINARQGGYVEFSMRSFQTWLGSDEEREEVWLDIRTYHRVPHASRHAIASWTYLWWLSGGHTPYLDLPSIGWDTYGRGGRGYVQGRMRGAHQAYGEVEYRVRLTQDDLLGAVAFVNLTGTGLAHGGLVGHADVGFGGGLRFKLTKRTDANIALDVGRGDDGETRVYVAMQEAY